MFVPKQMIDFSLCRLYVDLLISKDSLSPLRQLYIFPFRTKCCKFLRLLPVRPSSSLHTRHYTRCCKFVWNKFFFFFYKFDTKLPALHFWLHKNEIIMKYTHSHMSPSTFTAGESNSMFIIAPYHLSYVSLGIMPLLSRRIHWKRKQLFFNRFVRRNVTIYAHWGNISVTKVPPKLLSDPP